MSIVRLSDMVPGHKMCCSCLEFIPIPDLFRDAEGQAWDFCVPCAPSMGYPSP